MKKTFALRAIFTVMLVFGFAFNSSAAPASVTSTLYWLGSNGTDWTAANNWSSNATGSPVADFADGDDIVFSATGSSNSTNTDLGGDISIGSLTIDTIDAVGISGGNLTITGSEAVTVSGTSGNVSISAPLILSGSAATLSIENAKTTLASIASASGLVKTGNGTVEIQNRIWVSELGGSLEVQSGNFVSRDGLSLGIGASNETAAISGNTTEFSSPTTLNVGYDGSGNTLAVENGATASAGSVWIGGTSPAANNSATVNGTGSSLTSAAGGSIAVGYAGANNTLTVSNGGSANSTTAYIGFESTANNNTATVDAGSSWTNTGHFHIGYNGTGNTLSVANGGNVTTTTQDAQIGFNAGSNNNSLSVNGTGSRFITGGGNKTLYVGNKGTGNTLTVLGGGNLTTYSTRIGSDAASSNNTATISGNGSIWNNANTLRVGSAGSGNILAIIDSGTVGVGGNAFLGYSTGSNNNLLTVNGTGSTLLGTELVVGRLGASNTLSIVNAGNATLSGNLAVGFDSASSNNTALVSGAGSTLSAQNIQIGAGANNNLTVANSGLVSTGNIALAGVNATLQIGNGAAAGNLSLTGSILTAGTASGRSVVFNHTDSAYQFANGMSGDLAVLHSGNGTTTLTANNTYTGDTTISAGTLSIGNGGTTGSISGNVMNNAALVLNRVDETTFSGEISGTGSVVKLGNATTALTADNTYLGGTTISAGTLSIGNGSASGSIAGNVTNNAALVFNRSDAATYSGTVTGNGTLEKLGTGALTLSGNSTYSGSTILSGGSLNITGSINGTSSLTLNGGSALGITGTLTANGAVNANSGSITIGQGGSFKAVGSVVGEQPKEYLFVANYGTQPDLTNPSVSVFDLQTKTLNRTIGSSQNLNFPGGLALDSSGSLYVANYMSNSVSIFSNGTYTGNITNLFGPGGLAFNPDGKLYVANSNSTSVSIFSNGNPTTPITSNLFKPYDLAFSPSGNLYVAEPFENKITIFSSNNSYTGDIPVIGANFIAFSSNGTLYAVNTEGTKISAFANNTFVSDLPITTTGTFSGLTFDANDNLYVAESRFDSNDPYKSRIRIFSNGVSTGEITSNLASPGFLTVGSLSSATSIPVGITLAESASDNATLNIGTYGGSDTNATLTTPYIAFGNGTAVLNLNLASNFTLSAALTGGGANSTINQLGNGTTTLTSTNSTFTGAININSGTLAFTGSLANANTHVNSGGTLAGIVTLGNVTINSGGAIAPGNSPGTITVGSLTLNGGSFYNWQTSSINGTAGTNWDLISSTGTLTLNASSGNPITIDVSSLGDATLADVKKASWEIGNFSAGINGFDKNAFLFNPASMTGNAGSYFMSLGSGNLTLLLNYKTGAVWNTASGNWSTASQWEGSLLPENGDTIEFSGTGGISANDGYLTSVSGITFTSTTNGSYTLSGTTLTLESEGLVNNSNNTQTIGINLTLGANQTFAANTANLVVSGNISGNASLTKAGNQTLTLSGNNAYTGETAIDAGTLAIAAGGSLNGTSKIFVGNTTSSNNLSILGAVSTVDLTLSHQVGSDNNTVTVGGGSSPASLTVANLLNVGFGGTGNTLDILGNGTVTAGSTEIGGTGNELNLAGGVLNTTGYLVVGYFADDNALNITAGGNATVGSVTVGLNATSANNTILVSGTGSALHTAGLIYLGENGTSNSLVIQNGGKVVSQNADAVIGFNTGSNGNALSINGTGSQFTNNGTLFVGKAGSENTLAITDRGNLTTKNSRIGGDATSGNNTVTVSGVGSVWNNSGKLRVGSFGSNNSLTIIGGGAVVSGNDTFLGAETGSTNNLLTVNGTGSSFSGATDLVVGYNGNSNILTVSNGGNVSLAGSLAIGYNAESSNNTATISGVGSTLSAQNIQIGSGADNKLIVADSGLVSTANIALAGTNATLQVGNGTSAGNLSLTGSILTSGTVTGRSVVFNHTDSAYQFGSILSGDLAMSQVGTGTTTLTANNTYTGGTTISAGTLALGGTQGLVNGTIFVGAGASFSVNRTNDFSLGNIISGAGSFAHIGSNKTSITAANNYTGGTTISSGTLWTKNSQALGTGNVLVNGGKLLTTSSQEPIMGNQTLSIGGNLDWTSGKIAFYDTGSSPLSGDLTINVAGNFTASAGNKTFDFSEVEALGYGNYTLVNATVVSAGSAIFVAAHGPYTTLFGNFTTTNNTVVYTVTGAESTGSDIQNNGGPNTPVVAVFDVTQATQTIGANNTVNALDFSNSASLTIDATGQLTVTSGTLGVQTGSSVVSGGTLNTPGNFDKTGAGELDLDNTTNVNGIANVVAGLLSVNGQLNANAVMVDPTATLGGAGVIVAQNVVVNGNLSPGNSPGTLNVVGNLVLGAGSSTVIEIASPTNFDRIVVSGTATLGGTLNAVAYGGGTITPGARYDFLQAGSIAGEFDSLIAPDGLRIRFLNSGTVGTLLFGPASFVPYALNQNQINLAKALDKFVLATEGDAIVVGTALDSLTTEQFPAAFDQIMPGFYESLANIAIEQAFAQTQMLNQRISSVRLGAAGFQAIGGISQPLLHDKNGKSAAEAKDASPIVESATATNWNAWALGTGMFSRTTNLGSVDNYNNNAGGFLVGADYRWSENFVTGLYGGYDYSYAEYNGGGSTKGNSFNFGTYASYAKDGYYADAVIGGGYTGFQTKRSIEFSTIDRTASADPNSGQFTAGLNLGKDFEVGKFTLGPIVGAQYTYAGIGSFTESGAESLDLSLGQQNANSLRSTLGGRIAYTWNLNQKIALIPEVRMFWQHEFLNNPRNISASLDGGNGAAFDFETTDPYRDSVFAGAGVTAQFGKNLSGSVFYNINFGSQTYQSNMVSAGLNFSF